MKPVFPTVSSVLVTSCFSHVQLFATPWTVALQTPLSMGFSIHAKDKPAQPICPAPAQPAAFPSDVFC